MNVFIENVAFEFGHGPEIELTVQWRSCEVRSSGEIVHRYNYRDGSKAKQRHDEICAMLGEVTPIDLILPHRKSPPPG